MNYILRYDYDNYYEIFECVPAVRNGACFEVLGCKIKFYQTKDPSIVFWINGNNISRDQAKRKLNNVCKIISFIFALSFNGGDNAFFSTDLQLETNNILSKTSLYKIDYIEKKINNFKATKQFFEEVLDLIIVAYDNLYNIRDEDAFVYFFKVIERIAKKNYLIHMQRHHTKSVTKKNKQELRKLIEKYANDFLLVNLTKDMMDRKIDMIYKKLNMEFYGSVFNKISLFISKENIDIDINNISNLVKIRNKIAHGDIIEEDTLLEYLGTCEYLSMQMFSLYFFRKKYEDIHICSYRFRKRIDNYSKR